MGRDPVVAWIGVVYVVAVGLIPLAAHHIRLSHSPPPTLPRPQPRGMALQISLLPPHITVYVLAIIHRVFRPMGMHSWPSCPFWGSLLPRNPAPSVWCFSAPLYATCTWRCPRLQYECKACSVALCPRPEILSSFRVCRDSVARVFRILTDCSGKSHIYQSRSYSVTRPRGLAVPLVGTAGPLCCCVRCRK